MRGDLREGSCYASRCLFPLFPVPIPGFPSTKSGFLCFLGLWNPHFRAFRAQNRGFCALLGSGTLIFRVFEHKIGVFVLKRRGSGIGKRNRGYAYHFATAPTPSHQRTSTSAPATAPQQWYQAPSSAIWCRVMPSSTVWHRLGTM